MELDCQYKKLIRRWDSERELFYDDIFNHFYSMRPGSYRIRWNNADAGLLVYSSPNLSGRRLDVYHTSTYGVALVRI